MRILFVLLLFFSLSRQTRAQEAFTAYSALTITDSLKKEAHVVHRLDEAVLDVISPSKYVFKVHQITTILDEEGSDRLRHTLWFDKFVKVQNIEINVYNRLGLPVKKYSKKDFSAEAAFDGISLVTDDKVMRLVTPAPGYPCTVEVSYTQEVNGYIELPDWYVNNRHAATEVFRYVVTVPNELDIRFRTVNISLQPKIETTVKGRQYRWEAYNIKGVRPERGGFESSYYMPKIQIAPSVFQYDGYPGEFRNWTDFGKWSFDLYQEKSPFSQQRIIEIRSWLDAHTDVRERIEILYAYLQKNMRYVSIQLGIGGFKPFPVKYVDEKKYGDCKALTNYMRNLLEVAGIRSYPALINAGYDKAAIDPAFPSSQFNHVILCVPNNKDTIWLECTSTKNVAGFLGSFTENKNALLLTENGGILVKTPASNFQNNLLSSHTDIFLDDSGGANTNTRIYATGEFSSLFYYILQMEQPDHKEAFVKYLNYREPIDFLIDSKKDSAFGQVITLKQSFDKLYDFKAGNKLFYQQKVYRLDHEKLEKEKRTIDYIFQYPYQKTDTTIYHFPGGYSPEELPQPVHINSALANYSRSILFDPSSATLRVITELSLKKNIINAKEYGEITLFFDSVLADESEKLIFKKE